MLQTKLPEIISAAIRGFEAQKAQIDRQIAELKRMLDGDRSETVAVAPPEAGEGKRRRFSPAVRRKIAMAQKARWAAIKQKSEPQPVTPGAPRPEKRRLSAAGRKAISEATKKRWAALKALNQVENLAVAKKTGGKKAAA